MIADREFIVVLLLVNISIEQGEPWREETMKRRLIWKVES
jgi:hypothetical protein